jgi:hypothetical protein
MKNEKGNHIFIIGKEEKQRREQKRTDCVKVFHSKDTEERLKKLKWTETKIGVCRLHDDVDTYSDLNHGT